MRHKAGRDIVGPRLVVPTEQMSHKASKSANRASPQEVLRW